MAGRPKTMYRRINRLLERYYALHEDFEQRMPQQYAEPSSDPLGECWRKTSHALYAAEFELEGLDYMLYCRANAATAAGLRDAMIDREDSTDFEADDDAEDETTKRQLQQARQTVPDATDGQQKSAGTAAEESPEPPQS